MWSGYRQDGFSYERASAETFIDNVKCNACTVLPVGTEINAPDNRLPPRSGSVCGNAALAKLAEKS